MGRGRSSLHFSKRLCWLYVHRSSQALEQCVWKYLQVNKIYSVQCLIVLLACPGQNYFKTLSLLPAQLMGKPGKPFDLSL